MSPRPHALHPHVPYAHVPRLGVVWCPHWPVVVAGAAADEPVAVLHANRVVAHSLAAAADGVAVGQRRREAQARCPSLRIEQHDPARDARLFETVVRAVGVNVPRLEVTEPGLVTFAARGPARYFGGELPMAQMLVHTVTGALAPGALAAAGHLGVGVADGRFAAVVAARRSARTGEPLVVPAGGAATAAFLAPLSTQVLVTAAGVPVELVHLFQRLGLHRLGHLAELPEADLLARFGAMGVFARRLATGADERLPGTVDPPEGLAVQQAFDQPVHHSDALVFVGRQLAEQLVASLAADGRVCTRLLIVAETEHGERGERLWFRSAGLSAAAMVERVRWQLDAWAQQAEITAGVTLLRLDPVEARADDGVQLGLWGGRTQADEWAVRAVARLASIAGEQQVVVPAMNGGRHPQEAYTWVPAVTADLFDPGERLTAPAGTVGGPWPGRLPTPSPALVHNPPLPAMVTDVDGRPVRVTARGGVSAAPATLALDASLVPPAEARPQRVQAWAGPWPVEERWWDMARARRMARFQVLTDTGHLLLLVVERGEWWLTAEWA